MAMIGKIRRLHRRQNKSMREIARLTSLSRNTIRKYLKAEVAGEPQYRRAAMPTKLTPFHAALDRHWLPTRTDRGSSAARRWRCPPRSRRRATAAATRA